MCDEYRMNLVKIPPTSAQITPAETPPRSAARGVTRVFGTNRYIQVKATVTMT